MKPKTRHEVSQHRQARHVQNVRMNTQLGSLHHSQVLFVASFGKCHVLRVVPYPSHVVVFLSLHMFSFHFSFLITKAKKKKR
jgi:hypothetical protein